MLMAIVDSIVMCALLGKVVKILMTRQRWLMKETKIQKDPIMIQ